MKWVVCHELNKNNKFSSSLSFTQAFMPVFFNIFYSFSRSLFLLDEGKVVFLLLQMRTWRRLHDSIICWRQNLQKHPSLLSLVFSRTSAFISRLVLTLFFNRNTQLTTETREFLRCYCCSSYPYRVMLLFRPWIRKRGREQKYDVFTY